MILADKLIQLRKKNGWSQEELAEQMNVSRQAVCKWEGAQSIPDINKLIQLSKLFNVSLDYLLKDEVEEFEYNMSSSETEPFTDEQSTKRFVSMEEANAFLKVKEETSGKVAFGVSLCILSMIPLFSIEIFEGNEFDEIVALCVMFAMVSIGVAFIVKANIPWESMKKLLQEGDYSVAEKERKRKRKSIAGPISGIYWMLATAFFLILTFAQPKFFFYVGGIFWAVAGILFVAVLIGCKLYEDREKK